MKPLLAEALVDIYMWDGSASRLMGGPAVPYILIQTKGEGDDPYMFYAGPVDGLGFLVDPNGNLWIVGEKMRVSLLVGEPTDIQRQMYEVDRAMHRGIGQSRPPARHWGPLG